MTHTILKVARSLIVTLLIFNINLCIVYANNNNINLDKKKEYPYSAECMILVKFKTPKGQKYTYFCTGQLVDKNKVLTCGHEFKFTTQELYNDLNNADKDRSSNTTFKPRDELYELELQHYNEVIKQKESERQERIDSYLTDYDIFILEKHKKRDKSSITDEYNAIIKENNERRSKNHPNLDGPVGIMGLVSQEEIDEIVEKEKTAIELVDKQIEEELANELEFKPAWEFPEFLGVQIDFMFDTKNQKLSTDDLYTIPKDAIIIYEKYDSINSEDDIALIKMNKDIGYTYGWFGLLSQLEEGTRYGLAGYPTENESVVFKNLELTSRLGIVDTNIGIKNDSLYWYNLNTSQGFSGAGLRVKSKYGDDYRVVSIHKGKDNKGNTIGVRMTGGIITWIQSID